MVTSVQTTAFRVAFFWLCHLVAATAAHAIPGVEEVEWLRDVDEACIVAARSDRDVFVVFTGRGWCRPCELLDQHLFHDVDFVSGLETQFVPVELDFTFGDSDSEKLRKARFQTWAKRYLVLAYPTIICMDSKGRPFLVAESPQGRPNDFMARIEQAIVQRKARDEYFTLAESAAGAERVQHLHAGLLAVAEQLPWIETLGDDPLLTFYANEVEAIMTAPSDDEDLSEVREFLRNRAEARNERLINKRFWSTLTDLQESSKFDEGIALLKQELASEPSSDRRLSLELALMKFLLSQKRYVEAVAQIDKVLSGGQANEQTSRHLLERKVKILFDDADRKADAYTTVDELIAASPAGTKALFDALELKGMMLWEEKPASDAAIKAWNALRDAVEPGTFEHLTASAFLARCEHAAGNSAKAAELWDELLSVLARQRDGELDIGWPWTWDAAPGCMIEAAEAHAAAQSCDTAEKLLKRAEAEIERRAQSDNRERTRQEIEWLRDQLKAAQQSISATKKGVGEQSDAMDSR